MKNILAIVAALLAIAGNLPYLFDILKGRVKPHSYTWFVWSVVSAIVFFGQIAQGAGIGALPTAASELFRSSSSCSRSSKVTGRSQRPTPSSF